MVRFRGDTAYSYTGGWSAGIVEAVGFDRPDGFGYYPDLAGVEVSVERIPDLMGTSCWWRPILRATHQTPTGATLSGPASTSSADQVIEIDSGSWTIESIRRRHRARRLPPRPPPPNRWIKAKRGCGRRRGRLRRIAR